MTQTRIFLLPEHQPALQTRNDTQRPLYAPHARTRNSEFTEATATSSRQQRR
uniref:Uncharacterized protein n=1 Tax=Solanum tuberosum TaxID=4113 RepID=M1BZ97_SOLTU